MHNFSSQLQGEKISLRGYLTRALILELSLLCGETF